MGGLLLFYPQMKLSNSDETVGWSSQQPQGQGTFVTFFA